ncbi:FliH/SctL family protein [Undibacterium flavidum]|nr:FliH/SctL family protein [Undibacterium flavidum]
MPAAANVEPVFDKHPVMKTMPDEEKIKEITEKARAAILTQLKDEVDSAKEVARQRGFLEGKQAGIDEAKREFAAQLKDIEALSTKVQTALKNNVLDLEDIAVAVTFEAVCKMMGASAHSCDAVRAMVKQVLKQCANSSELVVHLHPADLRILREQGVPDFADQTQAKVSWIADTSLQLGGCTVEVDGGVLDARLETQLGALKSILLAARAKQSE